MKSISCKPCFQDVSTCVSLPSLSRVVAAQSNPAILGGNDAVRGLSIFAAEPVEVFAFGLDEDRPFEKLHAFLSTYQLSPEHRAGAQSGFCGGWIGYFGYELGRFIETLPQRAVDDLGLPVIRLAFYDKAIVYDHPKQAFSLVALEMDGAPSVQQKFDTLHRWLQAAQNYTPAAVPSAGLVDAPPPPSCNMTQADYCAALKKIHQHILDGDVYQINFSQRFALPFTASPIDLFDWQNRHNPSPYAAYLAWGDTAIVSASPELFLEVCGDDVVTRPIKGTRPRNGALPDDAAANHRQFAALVESQKDQAELAMIVDLERNDLARVCVPGTRGVPCARRIEAFATVYHAVATVEGTLAEPPSPQRIERLLRATFPGGSITGAPKISAIAIIDALEPTARGIYTGSIGWIGLNFDLCLNIAIRTIVIDKQTAYIQAGGGIVADSDPQAEWDETLTKARALLAGVAAVSRG